MTIRLSGRVHSNVEEDSEAVLDGLILALTRTPPEFKYYTMFAFKLTPFQNNAIGRDRITKLINQQTNFLHNSMATSAVDGGDCHQHIENEGKSIVHIFMDVRGKDGMLLFDSIEPGRPNQWNFIHPRNLKEERGIFRQHIWPSTTGIWEGLLSSVAGRRGTYTEGGKAESIPKNSRVPLESSADVGVGYCSEKRDMIAPSTPKQAQEGAHHGVWKG